MPSSKGGKEFAEQEFRYTISELTRAKLNGFYREAIDSLFKNFQIKFWLQVCSTLYKWRRVNVSVCACTCGREPAGTWLNYECKWAWILPTVRSVSQWTCFPFFTHPFCSSFFFFKLIRFPHHLLLLLHHHLLINDYSKWCARWLFFVTHNLFSQSEVNKITSSGFTSRIQSITREKL